jgi:dUTP pyrophosphatase
MTKNNIYPRILTVHDDFMPVKAHHNDAAFDVRAAIKRGKRIAPGTTEMIPLGFKIALPEGYELEVVPRSGLAAKNLITITNSPGTVDAGYRGEVCALVHNLSMTDSYLIKPKDRIAQIKFREVIPTVLVQVSPEEGLPKSTRGEGGFGSTGIK